MDLADFHYDLPDSLIAQEPLADRTASRLMVADRASGGITHAHFGEVGRWLGAGDVLVLNRSRVVPARLLIGRGSGGRGELVATTLMGDTRFRAIGSPLRKLRPGNVYDGADGDFRIRIVERVGAREVLVEAVRPARVAELLDEYGHMPLPPYIARPDRDADRERYQTVFARERGSAAAPTAGLHFDEALLRSLVDGGVEVVELVLHVGLGTFLPLDRPVVEENVLHAESFAVDGGALGALRRARRDGRRIVAVGTTTTRVLETLHRRGMIDAPGGVVEGSTDIFIYPGYEFGVVDALITNFHLPQSSLLLLVCAFLGRERTLACYRAAVEAGYRFYSYGDAMFIC